MTNHIIDSQKVFRIARKHLAANTSARVCMEDAMRFSDAGNMNNAMRSALRSIAHSVGIFHPDYERAFNASGVGGEVRLVCLSLNS